MKKNTKTNTEKVTNPRKTGKPTGKSATAPAAPSPEPEAEAKLEQPRAISITPLQATVELVKRGRRGMLPRLRELLQQQPAVWEYAGDLARQTVRAWIELIGGNDDVMKESMALYAEQLQQDLAGKNATPLERIVAQRIVVTWLRMLYFDALEAQQSGVEGPRTAELRMKKQAQADRQFTAATTALATIRKLMPRTIELNIHPPAPVSPVTRLIPTPAQGGDQPGLCGGPERAAAGPGTPSRIPGLNRLGGALEKAGIQ